MFLILNFHPHLLTMFNKIKVYFCTFMKKMSNKKTTFVERFFYNIRHLFCFSLYIDVQLFFGCINHTNHVIRAKWRMILGDLRPNWGEKGVKLSEGFERRTG